MQRIVFLVGLAVFGVSIFLSHQAVAQRRGEAAARDYGWESSYRDALATAKRQGKPLMVVHRCVP